MGMYWISAVTMSAFDFSEVSSVHRMGNTGKREGADQNDVRQQVVQLLGAAARSNPRVTPETRT